MAKRQLPCPTVLRLLLDYNPETGEFTWRERPAALSQSPARAKAWGRKHAGTPALTTPHCQGYKYGGLLGTNVLAHRAAFAIAHGRWPIEVDHINGDKTDNRLVNLREATRSQNLWNTAAHADAASKYKGVSRRSGSGAWRAEIRAGGKNVCLGTFETEKEAALAYNDAARRLRGNFARLNEVT